MHPCPFCSCHVRRNDAVCPHCGTRISAPGLRSTAAAALLGLAVACTDGKESTSGVDYGVSPTDTDTDADSDSDTDADTDADSDADSDTDTDTDTGTTTASGDTGSTGGVDYGTPPTGGSGGSGTP